MDVKRARPLAYKDAPSAPGVRALLYVPEAWQEVLTSNHGRTHPDHQEPSRHFVYPSFPEGVTQTGPRADPKRPGNGAFGRKNKELVGKTFTCCGYATD